MLHASFEYSGHTRRFNANIFVSYCVLYNIITLQTRLPSNIRFVEMLCTVSLVSSIFLPSACTHEDKTNCRNGSHFRISYQYYHTIFVTFPITLFLEWPGPKRRHNIPSKRAPLWWELKNKNNSMAPDCAFFSFFPRNEVICPLFSLFTFPTSQALSAR